MQSVHLSSITCPRHWAYLLYHHSSSYVQRVEDVKEIVKGHRARSSRAKTPRRCDSGKRLLPARRSPRTLTSSSSGLWTFSVIYGNRKHFKMSNCMSSLRRNKTLELLRVESESRRARVNKWPGVIITKAGLLFSFLPTSQAHKNRAWKAISPSYFKVHLFYCTLKLGFR